jgi:hypothetical protein
MIDKIRARIRAQRIKLPLYMYVFLWIKINKKKFFWTGPRFPTIAFLSYKL